MPSPDKIIFLALVTLAASVAARPGGAPACAINAQRIQGGMGAPEGDRSFRLEASATEYIPGQPLNFRVTSTNPAVTTYKGILLYVQPATADNQRVGTFTIPQGHKDNMGLCAGANIQAGPGSVLTHSSSDNKALGANIVWTAPANIDGNLVVRAVIVGTGPKNWQILENLTLTRRGGTGLPMGSLTGGRRKCKRWRKIAPTATALYEGELATPTVGQGAAGSETPAPAPPTSDPTTSTSADPSLPTDSFETVAPPGEAGGLTPENQAAAGLVQEKNTNGAVGMRKSNVTGMVAVLVAIVALAI